MSTVVIPLADRFWSKVRKSDGCWEWTSSTNGAKGYGKFHISVGRNRRRMVLAHRFAWELVNGPIPAGLIVCHSCDTPLCVRPDHMFLGTHADNMADMIAKGRKAVPRRYRGEQHASSMVSESDVRQMLSLRQSGLSVTNIAVRYPAIGRYAVWAILTGRSWKHIHASMAA